MAFSLKNAMDSAVNSVKKPLTAGLLATALTVSPPASTEAQAEQVTAKPCTQADIKMSNDAAVDALVWSQKKANTNGVAMSVFLGTQSKVTPQQICEIVRSDFAKNGISQVEFFFEQNDVPSTGAAFANRGYSHGPYDLGVVRKQIPELAAQMKFEQSNPVFAYTGNN